MMTRDECVAVFRKHNFTENQVVNMVVLILGAKTGALLELKGLSMKAYLNTSLEIVYNEGKRFSKLEEAIKTYAAM
jgi:hypothetical protein